MRYARLCEHDKFEPHWKSYDRPYPENDWCPGGEFLTDSELLAEVSDAELQEEWVRRTADRLLEQRIGDRQDVGLD